MVDAIFSINIYRTALEHYFQGEDYMPAYSRAYVVEKETHRRNKRERERRVVANISVQSQ